MNRPSRVHPQNWTARQLIRRYLLALALVASVSVLLGLASACRTNPSITTVGALAATAHPGPGPGARPARFRPRGDR